jgi:hypothetical protein
MHSQVNEFIVVEEDDDELQIVGVRSRPTVAVSMNVGGSRKWKRRDLQLQQDELIERINNEGVTVRNPSEG